MYVVPDLQGEDWVLTKEQYVHLSKPNGTKKQAADFQAAVEQGQRLVDAEHAVRVGVDDARPADQNRAASESEELSRLAVPTSPAFKRWFGDSKVVDEAGEPLVVYHGTGASSLNVFRPSKQGKLGSGIYLTPDQQTAERFAEKRGVGGEAGPVLEVYVAIEYPLVARMEEDVTEAEAVLIGLGHTYEGAEEKALDLEDESDVTEPGRQGKPLQAMVERAGYDGIILLDSEGEPAEYVAFSPTQIKSATGNVGAYGQRPVTAAEAARFGMTEGEANEAQGRGDTRFAVPADHSEFDATLGAETPMERLIRRFTNSDIRLLKIEEAFRAAGVALGPDDSTYGALERMPGRTSSAQRRWKQRFLDPLITVLSDANITPAEFDEYVYARHAKERNDYVRAKQHAAYNKAKTEGEREAALKKLESELPGSGMTTKRAGEILSAKHRSKNAAAYKRGAALLDTINRNTRNLQLAAGLISKKTHAIWSRQFKYYVPLRTSFEDETPGTGSGIHITGQESKGIKGRAGVLAHSPFAYSLVQAERAIVRGYKNEVGNKFLEMVEGLKGFDIRTETEEHDTAEGEMLPTAPEPTPYEFATKVQGKHVYIRIKDPILRNTLQNLGKVNLNGFGRFLAGVNRILSNINTSLDPGFVVGNFIRDFQTAAIHLGGEQSAALAAKVMASAMPAGSAQRAVWKGLRGKEDPNDPWLSAFHELDKIGGLTGWYHSRDFKSEVKEIQKELDMLAKTPTGQARRVSRFLFSGIEDLNKAVENGVRLAAYKHAVEGGMNKKEAASLAKNLTVNFNRKGEWGSAMNALYLFYNASVQGSVRMVSALAKSHKVQGIAATIIVTSMLLDGWNRAAGGDDEDGIPLYDKIPEYIKQRNMIIMDTDGSGDFTKVPLPYGYSLFHAMGQLISAFKSGVIELEDVASGMITSFIDSFNPIGSSASLAQFVTPTIADPIVQLAENQKFYGAPIAPTKFDAALTPDSQNYWGSVGEIPKAIAEEINELTGGDRVVSGWADVSPETLEHLYEFGSGGVGRLFARMAKVLGEDEVATKDIPLVRRVRGEKTEHYDREAYITQRDDVRQAEKQMKEYAGEPEMLKKFRSERAKQLRLVPSLKATESKLRKLRKLKRITTDKDKIKKIEDQISQIQATFSRRYRAITP